jgi:hypothetical protein
MYGFNRVSGSFPNAQSRVRTANSLRCAALWLREARYFSSCPSDPTSRWTPCPSELLPAVALALCFFGQRGITPAFGYGAPHLGARGTLNPPGRRAAQHALRVLGLGLFQDGDVGIGVLPEGEDVFIRCLRLRGVARHRIGTTNLQMGQCSSHIVRASPL